MHHTLFSLFYPHFVLFQRVTLEESDGGEVAPAFSRCTRACKTFLSRQEESECSCEPPAGQSSKWLCLFLSLKDNFSLPGCSTVFSHRKDDQTMHAKGYSASYSFYCHKLMLYQTRKYWNQTEHTANHFVLIAQHFVSLKDHQILLLKIHLSLIFLFWLGTRVPSTFLPWHALTPIILPFSREEVQCCQPTQTWVRSCYCSSVLFILQGGKGKR